MRVVSITGIGGGVGTTTVAAQLAATLAARIKNVIALDFSSQNMLRLHFGMHWQDSTGLVPQVLANRPWNEAAYRCENGVHFLPFGRCSEQDIVNFYRQLEHDPAWLSSRLGELDADDDTCVLIDCPRAEHALSSQAYTLSDMILMVAEADTHSYVALAESRTWLAANHAEKTTYLLNGFDPTLAMDRDIAQLIRADHGSSLCPITIHRDEAVREALASKICLDAYAPYSQASADFASLTTWLVARLAHLPPLGL